MQVSEIERMSLAPIVSAEWSRLLKNISSQWRRNLKLAKGSTVFTTFALKIVEPVSRVWPIW